MNAKEREARIDAMIEERAAEELRAVDLEAVYCDMLDECYSFEKVGGIFASMSPSRVLREVDPVAYRCGMCDYEDYLSLVEIGGEYYEPDDVDALRAKIEDELDAEDDDGGAP